MNEAEKMWSAAFSFARSIFDHPAVKAYYEAESRKNKEKSDREDRERRAKIEAAEAEKRRARAYDVWALNGGSDECTQFGINDGCHPWCPVFERGQCEMQEENEANFATAATPDRQTVRAGEE